MKKNFGEIYGAITDALENRTVYLSVEEYVLLISMQDIFDDMTDGIARSLSEIQASSLAEYLNNDERRRTLLATIKNNMGDVIKEHVPAKMALQVAKYCVWIMSLIRQFHRVDEKIQSDEKLLEAFDALEPVHAVWNG